MKCISCANLIIPSLKDVPPSPPSTHTHTPASTLIGILRHIRLGSHDTLEVMDGERQGMPPAPFSAPTREHSVPASWAIIGRE